MGSIIDRALDIINDHLKDQTSSFSDPVSLKPMARGGHVLEDDYPSHYLPGVGRQVMADGGAPIKGFEGRVSSPVPVDEPVAAEGVEAYHGSPHEFEEFDPAFIGTGEGAQAYGHGLYFAENEGVARDYRDRLTDRASTFRVDNIDMPKWVLRKIENHPDRQQAIDEVRNDFQKRLSEFEEEAKGSNQPWMASGKISMAKDVLSGLDKIESGSKLPNTKGRMYEVSIDAHPEEHLLDWDKPLSGQKSYNLVRKHWEDRFGDPDIVAERIGIGEGATGRDLYEAFSGGQRKQKEASKMLSDIGIRGIRYKDAGSRGMDGGSGSHNYVIFDPQHIKVKRRYAEGGEVPKSDDEGIVAYAFGNSVPHIEDRISKGEFPEIESEKEESPRWQDAKIGNSIISYIEHPSHIEIGSVRTPQKFRSQGAASSALNYIHDIADQKGKSVKLLASPLDKKTKLDKLVSLYRKHGYELTGEKGNFAGDPWMERKPKKAYGGAIYTPELQGDPDDIARRLILWSYAAAPLGRPLARAEGGAIDDPVNKAASIVGAPASAQNAVDIAKTVSPVENDLLQPIGKSKMVGDEKPLFDEGKYKAGMASYGWNNKRSIRYLHHDDDGNPIGALQIMTQGPRTKKAVIQNVYVSENNRRNKIASGLLKRARQDYDVRHSDDLTSEGRAFAKAVKADGGSVIDKAFKVLSKLSR